jgi:hypothetical protein
MTGTLLLIAISLAESAAAVSVPTPSPHWLGLVVVLVPPIDDDVTRNALARVSGELAAAPFKTITRPIDPESDVMAQVETAGSEEMATAAFALVRDREPGSSRVTIWVSNRISGTTTMQRMQVEGANVDRAAARLAVETVELVRASLAGLWPSRAAPSQTVENTAVVRPGRLALGAAVGMITNLGDAPSSWAPQITASYRATDSVAARLSASGLGPGADVSSVMGSARFEQALVTLGLVKSFRTDRIVQPMIGLAAGVHRLSAHGAVASSAQTAHDRDAFSALATASVGVALALSPRVAVVAEADLLMTWPAVDVRVDSAIVATYDRPSLFSHAGLLATF